MSPAGPPSALDTWIAARAATSGDASQGGAVSLLVGEPVLTEPAARRLAEELGSRLGATPEVHRRPARLGSILEDLLTYSLFAPAKIVVTSDTALFAERTAAADLLDEASEVLPLADDKTALGPRERAAASRLLQALRLFGMEPRSSTPETLLAQFPAWAFQGGAQWRQRHPRGRGKADSEELRRQLTVLLAAAQASDLQGFAEGDLALLGQVIEGGLPRGHALILAETSVAKDHPLVERLREGGAVFDLGRVESQRGGGWQGVDTLAEELSRQTGVSMTAEARNELARRTLKQESGGRGGAGESGAQGDSTARFAAEYRKLADLVGPGGKIERSSVASSTVDRGEEDIWKVLDSIADGKAGAAMSGVLRRLQSAEDRIAERLSFFSLLASFARQLLAVQGRMREQRVPPGEANYARFKDKWAPRLQSADRDGEKNPIAGLHPFRLHRVYLAASRLPDDFVATLPWLVLETELRLKGESDRPDDALLALVAELAGGAESLSSASRSGRQG